MLFFALSSGRYSGFAVWPSVKALVSLVFFWSDITSHMTFVCQSTFCMCLSSPHATAVLANRYCKSVHTYRSRLPGCCCCISVVRTSKSRICGYICRVPQIEITVARPLPPERRWHPPGVAQLDLAALPTLDGLKANVELGRRLTQGTCRARRMWAGLAQPLGYRHRNDPKQGVDGWRRWSGRGSCGRDRHVRARPVS